MIPTYNDSIPDSSYVNYGDEPSSDYDIVDTVIGPVGLQDPSQRLNVKFWQAFYDDGFVKLLDTETGDTIDVFEAVNGIKKLYLAFDQNANDAYAYIDDSGNLSFRWYRAAAGYDVTDSFGPASDAIVSMDMNYFPSSGSSDILLYYIRDGAIYCRVQRENYEIERATTVTEGAVVFKSRGMRSDYRFQVEYLKYDPDNLETLWVENCKPSDEWSNSEKEDSCWDLKAKESTDWASAGKEVDCWDKVSKDDLDWAQPESETAKVKRCRNDVS